MKDFSLVLEKARKNLEKRIPIVVCAHEDKVLKSVCRCLKENILKSPILIGDKIQIEEILKKENMDLSLFKIDNILDKEEASKKALDYVVEKSGDFLIKGLVDTSIILKAILNRKNELSLEKDIFLSHVAVVKTEKIDRLLLISDAAMNIEPDMEEKIKIIENSLIVSNALGIENPKIALIAAKEKVSPKMKATLHAKEVEDYYRNKHIIVEGPLALDNAVSKEAAILKGIEGKIKGDASILVMPNIEAGNVLYKSLTYFSNSQIAGVLIGAKVPIVITSRADDEESKFLSIALAALI